MQKKKNVLLLLSKMTFALRQSPRTFQDSGGVGCSLRRVFHKFDPQKNVTVLYVTVQPRQDTVHQSFNYANIPQRQICSAG